MSHGRLYQQRMKNVFDKKVCCASSMRGTLCWKRCPTLLKIIEGSGPWTRKDLSSWKGLFPKGPWCLPTWMARSYLYPWTLMLSSDTTLRIWGNWGNRYMLFFCVCVFFGFLQVFLFAVIVSSQLFKRKRHRSEASVLTLVLNHVQSVKTWAFSFSSWGVPSA